MAKINFYNIPVAGTVLSIIFGKNHFTLIAHCILVTTFFVVSKNLQVFN
ncbi:MAG TPA: hypothetical protein VIK55_20435 [Paludibacter sp.]